MALLEPAAAGKTSPGAAGDRRVGEDVDLNEVVLGGRYRLENLIGRGASSIVYRAHDTVLEQDVAIKVLRRDGILAQEQARALAVSLRKETRLAMKLAHPNVLRVYHYEQSGQTEYLVMELAQGENLHQLVQRRVEPRLSIREVVVFGLAVLLALEHAHGHGVIHNDLKPANILLCRPGGIKVCDFGLAQQSGTETVSATVAGTPAFMSPERIRGEPGDARSDLYSMGATFFALAASRAPYGDKKDAIHGHLEAPVPTSKLVPPALQEVLARAMAKRPADRYQSARALVVAWEAMAEQLRVAAPVTASPEGMAVDPDGLPTEPSLDLPPRPLGARDEPSSIVRRLLAPDERPSAPTTSSVFAARREPPSSSIFRVSGPLTGAVSVVQDQDRFVTTPSSGAAARSAPGLQREPATPDRAAARPTRWLDAGELAEIGAGTVGGRTVARFRLERVPVTNEAYAKYLAATAALPPARWNGARVPRGRERHPVVGVSLEDARGYAAWRGRRLPTSLEWLLAYGDGRRFPWGDAWRPEACTGVHSGLGETAPVGAASGTTPEGCADLLGNVWEWTEPDPRYDAPEAGKAWVFGGSFRHRVDAGGAPRTAVDAHNAYDYLGFRCAEDP